MLKLSLLGPARVQLDQAHISRFYSVKTQALLYYLAVESAEAHPRASLTSLLWPEFTQSNANRSLRQALFQLNKALDNPRRQLLLISKEEIQFNPASRHWLDVAEFTSLLQRGEWQPAVELYNGPFLDGFAVVDSHSFEEWLQNRREALHQQVVSALSQLTEAAAARNDHTAAQRYAAQTLAHAPWQEDAHRALMRALALQGQRTEALAQFARCRRIVEEEFAAPLATETIWLYEMIRDGALAPPQPVAVVSASPPSAQPRPAPQARLPEARTPLVGRQSQLTQILSRLTDPHCRVLTLVGLGGVGKTRLALEAAQTLIDNGAGQRFFPDGIWFVPLREAKTAEGAIGVVAHALGIPLHGDQSIQDQVLHHLRAKQLLLVLDNVEHLPSAPEQIAALLDAAPTVKLLVTSQQSLDLWDEWLFPVNGLAVPPTTGADDGESRNAPAATLFALNAQRRDPNFQIETEKEAVAHICRLVDGLPLALELAASWLTHMNCAGIAALIEANLDFLVTSATRIPERHRSIRAVLNQSWALLPAEEREGLRGLAVFRGSFHTLAAQEIARVPLPLLWRLVEKTLMHPITPERYQMHDLVRRHAEEKLLARPQEHADVLTRHSDFYLNFIAQRQEALFHSSRKEALAEVDQEFEHILSAWDWAAQHARFAQMDQAQQSLFAFCLNRGRYQEGNRAFSRLVEALDAAHTAQDNLSRQDPIYGRALARQGFFQVSSGDMEQGMAALEQALVIARSHGDPADRAFCLTFLGEFEGWRGNFDRARQLLTESIALNEQIGDQLGGGFALYRLGESTHAVGEFEQARRIFEECVAIGRRIDGQDAIGYALDQLGYCHFLIGDWTAAEQAYGESLHHFSEAGNELGVALASTGLGLTAWAQASSDFSAAEKRLTDSIARARRVGHPIHLTGSLSVLGLVQIDRGDFAQARSLLEEALALARQVDFSRGVVTCLNGLAHVCWATGRPAEARHLLEESFALADALGVRPLLAEVFFFQARLLLAESATAPAALRPTRQKEAATLLRQVLEEMPLQAIFRAQAQALLAEATEEARR